MTSSKQFLIFYFSAEETFLLRLYGIQIMKIHEIENLTLRQFLAVVFIFYQICKDFRDLITGEGEV